MSLPRWEARTRTAQLRALAAGLFRLRRCKGSAGSNVYARAAEEALWLAAERESAKGG